MPTSVRSPRQPAPPPAASFSREALETDERNPYVGPRPFERADGSRFFGRRAETAELVSCIVSHRLAFLYAQSGAGKTSLLDAGVIPALATRDAAIYALGRVSGKTPQGISLDKVPNIFVFNLLLSLETSKDVAPASLAGKTIKD